MNWGCRACAKGGAEINQCIAKLKAQKRGCINKKLITAVQDILKPKNPLGCRALCTLRGRYGCLAFLHKKRGISKKQYPSLNFYKNRTYLISFN
jgi:hypothetical protein